MSGIYETPDGRKVHGDGKPVGSPRGESSFTAPAGSDASPWPLRDIVSKLVEASDILLDDHNYDGHGWELISGARREAKEWLRQNAELCHRDEPVVTPKTQQG